MLKQRILSSLILLPLPILAFCFGTPFFELFCVVVLGLMGWEWEKLTLNRFSVLGMAMALVGTSSLFLLETNPCLAWSLPLIACFVFYFIARKQKVSHPRFFAFGMLYSGYPILSLCFIFFHFGALFTLWSVGLVWAMDSGAYFFGKSIGGPKLCPKISPKKTYAGLIGGMITAGLFGAICAYYKGFDYTNAVVTSAILGAFSQGGDLFESWIKRTLGVKDSSNLIPGHGGIFDRTDAILVLLPLIVLLVNFVFPQAFYLW